MAARDDFYYGENFIINLNEKRILYINQDADIEIPDYLDPISCGDIEPKIYNGHTYNAYCYNKGKSGFKKNDCMAFAEYITKGCLDSHKWSGECHLCEIETKDAIGYTDEKNIEIAEYIKKKLSSKKKKDMYKKELKSGMSVAIIERSPKVLDPPKGEKIVPYHVAYIMFTDKMTITSSGVSHKFDTIITIEADAGDKKRKTPIFDAYLKKDIPTTLKDVGFTSKIPTFDKSITYFIKPQMVILEKYNE